jgi:2,3-bisphosphoglycerate-independent phosphoglycerate mutase
MLPLKRDHRFKQGIYRPQNQDKFIGQEAIFRSGIELKFFRFCDNNPNIIRWGSENVVISYFDPELQKKRKYHIDNYVEIKEGNIIKKYLVEIKPFKQTQEPKVTKKRKKAHLLYEQSQWVTNSQGKWPAAREFAKKHGMEFIIITERELQ